MLKVGAFTLIGALLLENSVLKVGGPSSILMLSALLVSNTLLLVSILGGSMLALKLPWPVTLALKVGPCKLELKLGLLLVFK